MSNLNRRDLLKLSAAAITDRAASQSGRAKKAVIVIGAGIAGLSCAYELVRRGHDVTVLEASGRPGGHVRTLHDPFADGLYADIGAEHFYYPGDTQYWQYVHEFGLAPIPYRRRDNMVRFLGGKMFTEQDLHTRSVLQKLGFNAREIDFLAERPWSELPLLYAQRYVDEIRDETNPVVADLSQLDRIALAELLQEAALESANRVAEEIHAA